MFEATWQTRDMANPSRAFPPFSPLEGQPSIYLDPNGWNEEPYAQMGVMNKWFHTLCTGQGPNSQSITPISFDNAIQIMYHAVRFHLKSDSDYPHVRDVTAQAARELYGDCSAQERAVVAAWATAGLATIGCGSTCTLPTNTCYTIKVESSGKRIQAMGDNSVQQLPANGNNNQVWRVEDRGNSQVSFTVQDGSNRTIRTNAGANGEGLLLANYVGNGKQDWAVACNPNVSNQWRVSYPATTNTWDLEGYGNGPYLQLYGNTQESFRDYRAFRFEPATCPANNTLCDFRISMTSSLTTATCGQSVNFNVVCEGSGCQGVRYQWSGPGMDNQTGSSLNVTMPGTAGTYLYRVSALKTGCSDNGGVSLAIPVYCNGQVCTPLSNGCYNVVSSTTGNRLQAMADNRVFVQATNNANNQIWRVDNRGNERLSITVQDGTNRAMRRVDGTGIYEVVTLGNYMANSEYEWSMQCNPLNTTQWRVFSLRNTSLWDVNTFPNRDRVIEPELTASFGVRSTPFDNSAKFYFQSITCPNTGNTCNFALSPNASDGNSNRSCGQAVTLNANCQGGDCGAVSYNWSGNGISGSGSSVAFNVPNANGSYPYTVTASKSGCANQTSTVTLNVSGCGTGGGCNLPPNVCYTINVDQTGKRLQAMGNNTVQQQNTNNANDQVWRLDDRGNGQVSFTSQDGNNRVIQSNGVANDGTGISLGGYTGTNQHWAMQCNPSANNQWRVFSPATNSTWDMEGAASGPSLQIYGNTGESFVTYRSFRFEATTCPGGRVGVAEPAEPETGLRLTVSPNPNTGQFIVRFQTKAGQPATLRLSDVSGRPVRPAQTIAGTGQLHQEAISLPAQVRGLLLLEVVSGGQRGIQKVLIE